MSTAGLTPRTKQGLRFLLDYFRGLGYTATFTSGKRTHAKQAQLYAAYLRGSGLPANPPGHSAHELGLAVDVVTDAPFQVRQLGGQLAGLPWLGPRDPVHFGPASV